MLVFSLSEKACPLFLNNNISGLNPYITKTCPCNKQIFKVVKNGNFQEKIFDIFLIFALNTDCGYMLEPPRRGGF